MDILIGSAIEIGFMFSIVYIYIQYVYIVVAISDSRKVMTELLGSTYLPN